MKKFIFSLVVLLGALSTVTAQELIIGPGISIDKEVHDYGTLDNGSADNECVFIVTNIGTEPLIISKCKGSCGCTVPECSKTPIMAGESAPITVKYDTKKVGPINKSITITSNAVNGGTKVVRITGKVLPPDNDTSPVKDNGGAPLNK